MRLRAGSARGRECGGGDRIRAAAGLIAYTALTVAVLLVLLAADEISPAVFLAFAPAWLFEAWSIIAMGRRLAISTEGFIQTGLAIAFALLMIAAFR
jgi:hypothetical protein